MKRTLVIASLALNVLLALLLAGGLVWSRAYHRRVSFQLVADAAAAEVRLQEHVLAELESGDPARAEAVKAMLRRNVELGSRSAALWSEAAAE